MIYEFHAIDLDFGNNSEITYLPKMPEGESFLKIDPRAGFLHARKIFDSEEQTIYDFNVLFHGIKLQLSY